MLHEPKLTDADYQEVLRRLRSIHEREIGLAASAAKAEAEPKRQPRFERGIWMPEDEGELCVFAFGHKAAKHRIKTANPPFRSLPFDSIGISRTSAGFKLSTVQIKGTSYHQNGVYTLSARRNAHRPYLPGDFDFLAALVVPLDQWYIIPFHALPSGSQLLFHPNSGPRKGFESCDRYLDRWDLLQ